MVILRKFCSTHCRRYLPELGVEFETAGGPQGPFGFAADTWGVVHESESVVWVELRFRMTVAPVAKRRRQLIGQVADGLSLVLFGIPRR